MRVNEFEETEENFRSSEISSFPSAPEEARILDNNEDEDTVEDAVTAGNDDEGDQHS